MTRVSRYQIKICKNNVISISNLWLVQSFCTYLYESEDAHRDCFGVLWYRDSGCTWSTSRCCRSPSCVGFASSLDECSLCDFPGSSVGETFSHSTDISGSPSPLPVGRGTSRPWEKTGWGPSDAPCLAGMEKLENLLDMAQETILHLTLGFLEALKTWRWRSLPGLTSLWFF